MNRKRDESSTPFLIYFALILAAMIAAGGGVLHAYYKNSQVQVAREIDAIDRRVEQYRLDIRTNDMRVDQLLNRFAIRKQLEDTGSLLRPIPTGVIEEVDTTVLNRHSVASISP